MGSALPFIGGAELFCVLNIIPAELLCNMKLRILMYNLIAREEAEILYTVALPWDWR